MGHLTKIANEIVAVVEKGDNSELVKEYISGKFHQKSILVVSCNRSLY